MSTQVYSVPGQTEERRKVILKLENMDFSSKLSFAYEGNVNYYKSVHNLIPTCRNREHLSSFQNKSVNSPFN